LSTIANEIEIAACRHFPRLIWETADSVRSLCDIGASIVASPSTAMEQEQEQNQKKQRTNTRIPKGKAKTAFEPNHRKKSDSVTKNI
jgi:hypothetical protein